MNPTNYAYSDDGGGSTGFGPKSPCQDNAIDLADYEVALIGELAMLCMDAGTIQSRPFKGFWLNRKGHCVGMMVDGLPHVKAMCEYLRAHVPAILDTEGVGELLVEMGHVRKKSMQMFPNEDDNWLTMEEAIEFTGRKKTQIYDWISRGGIPTLDDRWGLMISKRHLHERMKLNFASKLSAMKKAREMNPKNQKV
ncbi:helix-turn-helix domain-containing protein [Corynebacterium phoceense]|uniref:helix-turn-helix transcriptional regulator n=1 Tax=Corynebacterium phoceense TaxID=1686286 RepID=UPI00211C2F1C|nr:helix-turn-helix domain-containing protein [Corynebacterium phoceense]MCQ9340819.1 helix-turn-helix domain-containing protein [Corynebacterium phoceense]